MSEHIVDYPQYEHLSIHEFVVSFKEEIVRCGDCRYYEDTGNCNWFECSSCGMLAEVTHDGFCAWGERNG